MDRASLCKNLGFHWESQMEIKYEIDLEDIVAFNLSHFKHSPSARKQFWGTYVIWVLISVPVLMTYLSNNFQSLICGAIACLAWALIFPRLYKRQISKQTQNMYREGKTAGNLGEHSLSLTEEALIERSADGETKTIWRAIDRVVESKDHLFIYINPIAAHIVPKKKIKLGNHERFLETLRANIVPPSDIMAKK